MSIFGIIGLSFVIALCVAALSFIVSWGACDCSEVTGVVIAAALLVVLFVIGTFVGIGIVTDDARVYATRFEVQKTTIEQSLSSDTLTGLERIELVNKAIELNGELAERKAYADLWHVVLYDESIYDNVEFIKFD